MISHNGGQKRSSSPRPNLKRMLSIFEAVPRNVVPGEPDFAFRPMSGASMMTDAVLITGCCAALSPCNQVQFSTLNPVDRCNWRLRSQLSDLMVKSLVFRANFLGVNERDLYLKNRRALEAFRDMSELQRNHENQCVASKKNLATFPFTQSNDLQYPSMTTVNHCHVSRI